MFADVRGFTRMTEQEQIEAQGVLDREGLRGVAAEAFLEERAQATLANVSELLATIADEVKRHSGTLDKYIGDCVMAFWGAPIRNPAHPVLAVRAAMEAQRAIVALNARHEELNRARAHENAARTARGERPLPLVPLLALGVGINTGMAVVGFMGSDAHFMSYTVFGREVNLASRLEGVAQRGQIIVSAATYRRLQEQAPDLADRCLAHPARTLKGIAEPVPIYEVLWADAAGEANAGGGTREFPPTFAGELPPARC
jgi:adenylate cyclase